MPSGDAWTIVGSKRRRRDIGEGPVSTPTVNPVPAPVPAPPSGTPVQVPPVVTPVDPFKTVASALLQHLSPQDAAALKSYYGIGEDYGFRPMWAPQPGANVRQLTPGMSGATRNAYLSADRAQKAMNAITSALSAAKITNGGGPGVAFLQNVINLLNKYGATGGQGMSRGVYQEFDTAINELFKQAEGNQDIGQFRDLASMFVRPTFAGSTTLMGDKANKKLYR